MKRSPNFDIFVFRVGGFFGLMFFSIMLSKIYWPGYEALASLLVCVLVAIIIFYKEFKKTWQA